MALIQCPECGKKFSDKASACPECGCPIEYILEELGKSQPAAAQIESALIHEYDIMGRRFTVDERLDRYIRYISSVQEERISFNEAVNHSYYNYKSVEQLIEELPDLQASCMNKLLDNAVETLTSNGVYEYDKARFMQKYSAQIDTTSIISPLVERYLQVMDYQGEVENYHNYIRECRKKAWSGGGFSIGGAIEGHIKAQLMNAGNVFLHALPDASKRSKDRDKVAVEKAKLLKEARQIVQDAMEHIFDACVEAVTIELINTGRFADYDFNTDKAASLLNNASKASGKQLIDIAKDAFFADPVYYPMISFIIDHQLSGKDGVISYAKDYGFLDTYITEKREKIEIYGETGIDEIYDKEDISQNATLIKILDLCITMAQNKIDVSDRVKEAVRLRLQHHFTENDFKEIRRYIEANNKGALPEKFLNGVYSSMEKRIEDNKAIINCVPIVKAVCEEFPKGLFANNNLLFASKTNLATSYHYHDFVEAAEVPKNAEIFAMYGLYAEKRVKYVFVIADLGLFANDEYYDKVACNWVDFSKNIFGKASDGITVGNETVVVSMYDDLYKLLKRIRDSLKENTQKAQKPSPAISNEEQKLEAELAVCAKQACMDISSKFHWPVHRFGFKKNLKETEGYLNYQKQLGLPEDAEIFYLYTANDDRPFQFIGISMTDLGIYATSPSGKALKYTWSQFMKVELHLGDRGQMYVDKSEEKYFCASSEGNIKYVFELLQTVQKALIQYSQKKSAPKKPEVKVAVSREREKSTIPANTQQNSVGIEKKASSVIKAEKQNDTNSVKADKSSLYTRYSEGNISIDVLNNLTLKPHNTECLKHILNMLGKSQNELLGELNKLAKQNNCMAVGTTNNKLMKAAEKRLSPYLKGDAILFAVDDGLVIHDLGSGFAIGQNRLYIVRGKREIYAIPYNEIEGIYAEESIGERWRLKGNSRTWFDYIGIGSRYALALALMVVIIKVNEANGGEHIFKIENEQYQSNFSVQNINAGMVPEAKQKEDSKKSINAKYCAFCGKQIERTAKFCNFCGEAVRE